VALVVESGDCREVHHVALLLGFGAAAVNPYLAFETIEDLIASGDISGIAAATAIKNYVKALVKGVLKVMSKMGISTVGAYTAAQAFEAIGLSHELVDEYFSGTASQLGGVGLDVLAEEVAARHRRAYPENPTDRVHRRLDVGGEYSYRREGELHLFTPETVFPAAARHQDRAAGRVPPVHRRVRPAGRRGRRPARAVRAAHRGSAGGAAGRGRVGGGDPDPVNTGAMSYGSISAEAHETLAIAMNNLGGRSNTGEGGEDVERLHDPRRRSAIKQVASGRFGVTSEYLVQADDIQIKMAQGREAGGGRPAAAEQGLAVDRQDQALHPGRRPDLTAAAPRHLLHRGPGAADPRPEERQRPGRIHVKLVSSVGVGTVAAGVAKAHADVVLISGHDGGTGAAALTALKHAGAPWEIGLADTQQTLMLNGLRDRIVVQTDGQMKTGRDVVVAALLGAEEYGFATAPLIVAGCVMMRVCHLDTCPSAWPPRTPSCAPGSPASPSSWRTSSGSSPRRSASTWPSWASARWKRPSGTPSCWTPAPRSSTGRRPVAWT